MANFASLNPFFVGIESQCYCEDFPEPGPSRCADEGEDCVCEANKVVTYMNKWSTPQQTKADPYPLSFSDGQLYSYTLVKHPSDGTKVKCAASSFDNVDPAPGNDKQCYCAAEGVISEDTQTSIIEKWKQKKKQKELED